MARRGAYSLLGEQALTKQGFGGAPLNPFEVDDNDLIDEQGRLTPELKRRQVELILKGRGGSLGNQYSTSDSESSAGPASTEEIMRLLDIAGMKNDGSKIDVNQFKSKVIPEYEGLQQMIANRPTEVSLRGLDQIANALSSTDRKVKFDKADYTADDKLKQYTDLGTAIQGQRDDEMKRQSDIFRAISGVTSQKGSSKSSSSGGDTISYTPPSNKGTGAAKKKPITQKERDELAQYANAIAAVKAATEKLGKNKNWTGLIDGSLPKFMIGADEEAFRSKSGMVQDTYRKLITGAAAADAELSRIEGRLPSKTDSYAQYVEKSKNYLSQLESARQRKIDLYKALDMDIGGIEGMAAPHDPITPPKDKMPFPVMSYEAWIKAGKPAR